jgi:hypothetical protein
MKALWVIGGLVVVGGALLLAAGKSTDEDDDDGDDVAPSGFQLVSCYTRNGHRVCILRENITFGPRITYNVDGGVESSGRFDDNESAAASANAFVDAM